MDISYYKQFEPIDGKWYITKELGSGAFGTVFEIQRKDFSDMKAALKVVSIPNSQSELKSFRDDNFDMDDKSVTSYFYGFVEEFIKEFQVMARLKGHSNIVSYEDHDVKPKQDGFGWDIFIRMELLTPINEYFRSYPPKRSDVIKIGIDICKALEVCQKYNIIHRDIKPSNIFISESGEFKLGDFGVARTLEKTSSGLSKKGTYTYMAPEVFKGDKYNSNVDIYSLGILMYKLLNNNMEPFRVDKTYSDNENAIAKRMGGEIIPAPANADAKLAEIVLKACSFNPGDRYESASQMRKELEDVLCGNNEGELDYKDSEELNYEPSTSGNKLNASDASEEGGTVSLFSNANVKVKEDAEDERDKTVSIFDDKKEESPAVTDEKETEAGKNNSPLPPSDNETKPDKTQKQTQKQKESDNSEKKQGGLFGNIKKWKIIVPAVVLVLLIAIGVGITMFGGSGSKDIDGTKIELYPTSSDYDLNEIEKSLKSRLKVIGGKTNTSIEDNKIVLSFNDEAFTQDPAIRKQTLNWVKTKGNIGIYCTVDYTESAYGKESFENIKTVELPKSDLEKYKKYFAEKDYDNLMNSDEEVLYVVGVKLNDSAKVYYDQMLSAVEDKLAQYASYESAVTNNNAPMQLTMDKTEYDSTTVAGAIVPVENNGEHTFYIVSPAAYSSKMAKLICDVLEEEKELSSGLVEKVISAPKWEEDTAKFGKNQVAGLDGKNIVIKFTPDDYYVDGYSQADIDAYMQILKGRLDTLGSPYAVGYTGIDYKTIMIKIPPTKLIASSTGMLMQPKSIVLNTQFKSLETTVNDLVIDNNKIVVTMNGNKTQIADEYNKSDYELIMEDLDELSSDLEDTPTDVEEVETTEEPANDSGTLYLLVNDVTIAQADLNDMTDEGVIEFSNFLCFKDGYCSSEEEYLFKLIEHINNEPIDNNDKMLRGNIEVLHYDGDTEITGEKIDWLYDSLNEYDRQTIRTIEKLGYSVEKSVTNRSTLLIKIDVELDEDMPKGFTDAVKEIYNECNFDDGSYSWIFFKIQDETVNHPDDRCRLVAMKSDFSHLSMTFTGLVDGPTFEDYEIDFNEIMNSDEFYSTRLG